MKKSKYLLIGALTAAALALPASAETMSHWAQIRDEQGEIIGRIDAGEEVEVLGVCEDTPYRSEIYYPLEDLYGTVASVYIYGGSEYEYENPEEYVSDADSVDGEDDEKEIPDSEADSDADEDKDPDEDSEYEEAASGSISIDIDLGAQRIYVYKDGEVVLNEECVSGTMDSMDTPTGEFTILDKNEETALDGGIYGDGSLYYVRYWMPITDYGIGIHDAAWRNGVFGGDIYQYDGSHGCINVDTWVARTIYEMAPVGTPVTIHY